MSEPGRATRVWEAYERRMQTYTLLGMRRIVDEAAMRLVGNALFPRLSARMRWTSRLGLRGVAVYVAGWVAIKFILLGPLASWSFRSRQRFDALRDELGRNPTPEEIAERFGWDPPREQG